MSEFDAFVTRVEQHTGKAGRRQGHEIVLLCPAHDDHHPSLNVSEGANGQPMTRCRSHHCTFEAISEAIGWNGSRPNEPAVYVYQDEQGKPLTEVGRFDKPDGSKTFLQRRAGAPDWKGGIKGVRRVLYHLPEVVAAVAEKHATIWITEGEKHADLLRRRGRVATTSPMGAGKWKREYADTLAGAARVFVVPDDDQVGRDHAEDVARSLYGRVGEVRVVKLRPQDGETHRDVIDFYAAGTREEGDRELDKIVEGTPVYVPDVPVDDDDDIVAVLAGRTMRPGTDRLARNVGPISRKDAAAPRRVLLTRIADVEAKRVEWFELQLIARGMVTGLVAPGGTVKGLYGVHISAKAALRDETTLFVCSEDALDYIVRPRFQAAGCDARLAVALSIDDAHGGQVPHFPSDLPLLAQAIEDVRPALVIIDPIASYIDAGLDMGKNNEMRLILQPLIELAHDARVAILVVYHHGKHRERGAIGTVAFEDACRLVLTAARDDDDEDVRHIELTKSNISATGYGRKLRVVGVPLEIDGETIDVAKLVDEGRSGKSVYTLLARKMPPGPEPEKRERARDVLIDVLVDGGVEGCNADEAKKLVAEEADVSASTVWRAFDQLKDEGLAAASPTRDEYGSIVEWRWTAKAALLLGRNDA